MLKKSLRGDLILLFVTLCWGLTFPLIRDAVATVNPVLFVATRFLLAALVLLPFVWRDNIFKASGILKAGLVLGVFNIILYTAQTVSLETISSSQSAFITGSSVVLVPLLLPVFRLGKPSGADIVCAVLCLLGLFVLTGAHFSDLSVGDAWAFVCAVSLAMSIVYLQKATLNLDKVNLLAFYQIVFTGVLAGFWVSPTKAVSLLSPEPLAALLFCAVMATSVALLLQTRYQRYTTASRAALIFTMEPIFGTLFAFLINGSPIGVDTWVGGALIIASILLSEGLRKIQSKN